jgi:hypothetical protein
LTKPLKDEVARLRPSAAYVVGTAPSLSAQVDTDLAAAGVKNVKRIGGATPAETAAGVAAALDTRSPADMTAGTPAATAAVVVNPAAPDAAAAVGLASSLRYPILFTGQNTVPAQTTSALHTLGITKVVVVGGAASVSDAEVGQFPGATRVSGSDPSATSVAVAALAVTLGVPANMVFVADPSRPGDAALAAAAAARVGGLVVLAPNASASGAQGELSQAHLSAPIDQIVVVRSKSSAKTNTVLIVVFIVLGAVGLLLLLLAFALRTRARERLATAA